MHALLAPLPVGLWAGAFALDVASHVSVEPFTFPRASFWLVVVGLVAGVVTSVTGLPDLLRLDRDSPAWRLGVLHLVLSDIAVLGFLVSFLLRRDTDFNDAVSIPITLISGLAVALIVGTLLTGGRLTYGHGVGVADADDDRS